MTDKNQHPDAAEMVALIKSEFDGVRTPVSAEHLAAMYGVLAAQSDAILAVYTLAMKANPQLIFSDARISAEKAMAQQADALSAALIQLAKDYGNTDSK
ncbi:hypothetical protein [Paracoccus sp. (in: a-proteobacteria)]|uniref:hypothetical protein n=1 Tax=Paracoccus sp. TaxID=267 RepID=UPI0028B1D676|nr:hypothetical protein [Paracoccus sp. (in: a-proteobacteria)]